MLLQAGSAFDPLEVVAQAGPVGLATLLVLLVMSVGSWAAWGSRRVALGRLQRRSRAARDAFLGAPDTTAFAERCRAELPPGPVPRMFAAAHEEFQELFRSGGAGADEWSAVRAAAGRHLLTRTLEGSRDRELARARSALGFLATVGTTAPFIGLFGTVWGVIRAFHDIGATRSAELTVVAPGIAEALIATAAGLVAAVPAVWFYNGLTSRVRALGGELDEFAIAFLNVFDRVVASPGPSGEGR